MSLAPHFGDLLTIAAIAGGILLFRRFGGGEALAGLERANRILTVRVRELEHERDLLKADVASLRARTDVALAVGPVLRALELHEQHATSRNEATLGVLALIADRLGPELGEA